MHYNLKIAGAFSKGAPIYDEKSTLQAHVSNQIVQKILQHEHDLENCTLLDIGSGTGRRAVELAP